MANDSDQISIREVMAVLQQMDAKLPDESQVVIRLVDGHSGDIDDNAFVAVAVSAKQGIGEPSELIIYVEQRDSGAD